MDPIEINEMIEREQNLNVKGLTYLLTETLSPKTKVERFNKTIRNLLRGYLILVERKLADVKIDYTL